MQWYDNIKKTINVTHYTNRIKDKNHIIISTDEEKAFNNIQYTFKIKTMNLEEKEISST